MKRALFLALAVVIGLGAFLAPPAYSQGGIPAGPIQITSSQGRPLAGATVTFCTSAGTGIPCTPLASIFTDAALTVAAANPVTTDGLGNLPVIYATPGIYKYTVSGTGIIASGPFTTMVASTGSLSSVASLPATCTPGVTAPVQLSVAPYGIYVCTSTNTWSLAGAIGTSLLASSFGVKGDAKIINDATTTNTSSTITCPNNDCNFTSADVGKIVYATNLTSDTSALTSVVVCAQSTIATVNSAQSITVTAANDCNATVTAAAVLVWGSDDSSSLTTAWTATVGICGALQLPSGGMIVQSGQFNSNPANGNCMISKIGGYGQLAVLGMSSGTSVLLPTPNFSAASCNGGIGANVCFFGATGMQVMSLTIYGAGQSSIGAGFNGKTAVSAIGTDAINNGNNLYWYNILLTSWGANTTGFTGITAGAGSSDTLLVGVHNDGVGATGCDFGSPGTGGLFLYNVFCAVNAGPSVVVRSGQVYSHGGVYGYTSSANTNSINFGSSTAKFYSFGDSMPYQTGSGQSVVGSTGGGGTIYLDGSFISNPTSGGYALGLQSGMIAYVRNTLMQGNGGAGTGLFICATCKFYDGGGNTMSGGTAGITLTAGGTFHSNPTSTYSNVITSILPACTFTSGGGTTPSCSLQAGSTNEKGTIIATTGTGSPGTTGTITLTFAGTYSGATGATPSCTYTPNDSATAWGNGALARVSTQSTTAPVSAWSNSVNNVLTALATSSAYRIDYVCVAR